MAEEIKTKSQAMLEELTNLKAALQSAVGDKAVMVQVLEQYVARMEEILQPTA
jgi:hypothetical protein